MPAVQRALRGAVEFDCLGGLTVGLDRRQRLVKRAFDVAGSLALIVLLAPVLGAIAFAIRPDPRGPALFRQVRVGRGTTCSRSSSSARWSTTPRRARPIWPIATRPKACSRSTPTLA
jgi:hypothetical protein